MLYCHRHKRSVNVIFDDAGDGNGVSTLNDRHLRFVLDRFKFNHLVTTMTTVTIFLKTKT